MTIQIRSLVTSAVCLVGIACSDASPRRDLRVDDKKSAPQTALPETKPSFAQEELAALAAIAEQKPHSVLDMRTEKKAPEPALEAKDSGAKELAAVIQHDEPIDYSRPLAPQDVVLKRFVLAKGVSEHEPLEESDSFSSDAKIFAFMELSNPDAEPYAFRVHWEPVAGPASPFGVELHVKTSPRFRTWSWTAIPREPGSYRAVLRTLAGDEIASREFTIETAAKSE